VSETGALAQINQARRFLEQAKDLTDIKAVKDMAEAARLYARARKLGLEAENAAAEIKVRADHKLGETLRMTPKQQPGDYRKRSSVTTVSIPPTLAEIGITRDESSSAQAVAALTETELEHVIAETKEAGRPITTAAVAREGRKKQRERTEAMLETLPDPGDAHRRAKIKRAYSTAVLGVMQGFMTLDAEASVDVLDGGARADLRRFIGSLRACLDRWESALGRGLRAVKGE
jgi:ribosomal protein L12E/L44/L45/RPP1/RPP2